MFGFLVNDSPPIFLGFDLLAQRAILRS